MKTNKGFTLIQLIIVIAILTILVAVMIPSLTKFRNAQALKNTTDDIVSLLNNARLNTISSLNSNYYSVHFESARAVSFTGGTFAEPNSSNKVITFNTAVTIPASGGINLNGGGSNVSFTRLTGDTTQYGTIVVQLKSDSTQKKTITINKTGAVSSN